MSNPLASTDDANHASAPAVTGLCLFPIRTLGARHRPRILAHLHALDERDRYLRFGFAATDAHISRYVDQLDFERDEVFGVFNRRLRIVALAHLAYLGRDERRPTSAEFGVSVSPHLRGRGIGARLFERACLNARQRGVDTLLVHALAENHAMLRIALAAGASIEDQGSDAVARVSLPPEDLASRVEGLIGEQVGALDFDLKRRMRRIDRLWRSGHRLIVRSGEDDSPPR